MHVSIYGINCFIEKSLRVSQTCYFKALFHLPVAEQCLWQRCRPVCEVRHDESWNQLMWGILCRHLIDMNPPWWKVPLQLPLYPLRFFLKTAPQGAKTQIHLCLSPKVISSLKHSFNFCLDIESLSKISNELQSRCP